MASYVKEFGGYISDVPQLFFKRCDGHVFHFNELTQASVTPNIQTTEINAGWSLYPVAVLPGQSTLEMQVTSGKFEAELFSMTNAVDFAENTAYEMPTKETQKIDDTAHTITLLQTPVAGSVFINGLTETTDYTVDVATKKITFTDTALTGEIEVAYNYTATVREAQIDNKASAVGEAVLRYPVYSDGTDCTKSGIIGYVVMRVYKCRVTAQPGMDGSYKQASTYQFTLSAIDAKRNDGMIYSIAYIKNA